VFSLGIVLYEMVTETKPFVGAGTEVSILELVRQCVITAAREINPRVPEPLDRVIMKALAREPDERYQDAGEMQRGLERFLRDRPPVSARDLARFLELLFDRAEREETDRAEVQPVTREKVPDPMSLDSLLERFGIDE
jgi:serine/threonine protein kinase